MTVAANPKTIMPEINNRAADVTRQIKDASQNTGIIYRTAKGASQVARWLDLAGATQNSYATFGEPFGRLANLLIFPRNVTLAISAKEALEDTSSTKKIMHAVHETADLIAASCYSILTFTGSESVKNVGDIVSVVPDSIDAYEAANEWSDARKLGLRTDLSDEMQVAAVETQRHNFLKLCKAVTALATGILGVLALMLGAPIAAPIVLLTISLASTVFALWGHFYKENMTYKSPLEMPAVQQLLLPTAP